MYIIKVRGPPIKSFLPSSWYQLEFKCLKYNIRFMGRKGVLYGIDWDSSILFWAWIRQNDGDQCVPVF